MDRNAQDDLLAGGKKQKGGGEKKGGTGGSRKAGKVSLKSPLFNPPSGKRTKVLTRRWGPKRAPLGQGGVRGLGERPVGTGKLACNRELRTSS